MEFYAKVFDVRGEGHVHALPGRFDKESGAYVCKLVPIGTRGNKEVFQIRDELGNVFGYAHIENGQFFCSGAWV